MRTMINKLTLGLQPTHHGCYFGCFKTQWKDTGAYKWQLIPLCLDPYLEKIKIILEMVIYLSFWGKK